MKEPRNIDRLIREQEHTLHESPGEKIWDRLSDRLDQQPQVAPRSRFVLGRQLAVAASLAVIVVAACYFIGQDQNSQSDATYAEQELEILDLPFEVAKDAALSVVTIDYKHPGASIAQSIEEGDSNKRLVVQKNIAEEMNYLRREPVMEVEGDSGLYRR